VSVALAGGTLPARVLVIADAVAHATNIANAVASRFTTQATVTSYGDNTDVTGPTCYLCNPIPTSFAFTIWQTEVGFESSMNANWALIKQNILDYVNAGRIFVITGENFLFNNEIPSLAASSLNLIGADDYVHLASTAGNPGAFTNYPTCDPMLRGFFGDIRGGFSASTPASYPGNQEDQTNVDITIAGDGQSICWEVSPPEIGVGGRFTSRQYNNGGFLLYMQCTGASDYDQFLTGFYNVVFNNAIDYAFLLFVNGVNPPPTQYREVLVVSTMPSEQLSSPINALYTNFYVPLVDIYASEDPTASILGSPINPMYDIVEVILHNSDYSSAPGFANYLANLQAYANAGGLVIIYGAAPELELDQGWIPFLGGSASTPDNSGLSNSFGSFAACSKILNGPFGTYVGINPRNLSPTLVTAFSNPIDTLDNTAASSCLDSNRGDAIISYNPAGTNGLIVYLASHSINNDAIENFQDVTLAWYRDIYNNLIANHLGLTGGAGGDPHIFTFGGDEIELSFQSGKRYVFYGAHDFSIVIGTVGYLDTIYIAEVGITMGSYHLLATQHAMHPVFKLNGEEITGSVHTPIGEASIFVPQESQLRGPLAELAPYVELGLRLGDNIEIVGGYYAPFIFFNIEIIRGSPSSEYGLLHAAQHQSKRDTSFLDQFVTPTLF